MEMEKIEKLVVSSHDKTKYVMHITILKPVSNNGLVLKKKS